MNEYNFWVRGEGLNENFEYEKITPELIEFLDNNKNNLPEENRQVGKLTVIKTLDANGSKYNFARWEPNGKGDLIPVPLNDDEHKLISAFKDPDFIGILNGKPVYRDTDSQPSWK